MEVEELKQMLKDIGEKIDALSSRDEIVFKPESPKPEPPKPESPKPESKKSDKKQDLELFVIDDDKCPGGTCLRTSKCPFLSDDYINFFIFMSIIFIMITSFRSR